MFLSRYDFTGDPTALHAALTRMAEKLPPDAIVLNVAVSTETGLSLYDTCPDLATFVEFSTSEQFTTMLSEVGLPTPTITPLGEVLGTIINVSSVPALPGRDGLPA